MWHARSGIVPRVVESGPGGEESRRPHMQRRKRCRTRARRAGGYPAWSRSRSACSPRPGTTGSPRSGSGSGGPARQTWPGCAPRGTRLPAGTGRRMRRRSGSCWTAWDPREGQPRCARCPDRDGGAAPARPSAPPAASRPRRSSPRPQRGQQLRLPPGTSRQISHFGHEPRSCSTPAQVQASRTSCRGCGCQRARHHGPACALTLAVGDAVAVRRVLTSGAAAPTGKRPRTFPERPEREPR